MPITPIESDFAYEKEWTDPVAFPTYEGSPEQVRADLQYHPDAVKDYVNTTLIPLINELVAAVNAFMSLTIPDHSVVNAQLSRITDEGGAAVDTDNIMLGAVDTAQLADGAVTFAKMGSNAVNTAQLVDGAVTLDKMGSNAVDTLQLVNGAVSGVKLGNDIVPQNVGFVIGTGDPSQNPGLLSNEQVYLKLES